MVRAVALVTMFRILVVVVVWGLRLRSVTPSSATGSIFCPPQAEIFDELRYFFVQKTCPEPLRNMFFLCTHIFNFSKNFPPAAGHNHPRNIFCIQIHQKNLRPYFWNHERDRSRPKFLCVK